MPAARRLSAVRVVGGLLPNDVVTAVLAGTIDGLKGRDYHLGSETPREAAARAWTHLLGAYRRFRDDLATLPDGDPAVAVTRERWLSQLLRRARLRPRPGHARRRPDRRCGAAAKQYPVSHLWGAHPDPPARLGRRPRPPQPRCRRCRPRLRTPWCRSCSTAPTSTCGPSLTNGRTLRLLRDSTTLTGQAYVEFDLEAMFDGELFSEFALLYLLCHQSRVEVAGRCGTEHCWLERWRTTAISQGVRALTLLRDGVETALETLGTGFLQHPANAALRESPRGRRSAARPTSTPRCCGPSTGCCSGPSPRTATRCSAPDATADQRAPLPTTTSPPPGSATSR